MGLRSEVIGAMEKRIVAHCVYIHNNAEAIQADRKLREKLWKSDVSSYFYWTREEKKKLKKKKRSVPVV